LKDYQHALSRKPENKTWLLLVQRGATSFFVTLEVEKKNGNQDQEQEQEPDQEME